MKDETTFRYAHAGIRTRVIVICGQHATARPRRRPCLLIADINVKSIIHKMTHIMRVDIIVKFELQGDFQGHKDETFRFHKLIVAGEA